MTATTVNQRLSHTTSSSTNKIPENSAQRNRQERLPKQAPAPAPTPTEDPVPSSPSSSSDSDYMQSDQVEAVLEMGFPKSLVEKVVKKCIRDRPGHLPHAAELASIVMSMEEQTSAPTSVPSCLTPLQRLKALQSGSLHSSITNIELTAQEPPLLSHPSNSEGSSITNPHLEASKEEKNRDSDNVSPTALSQRTTELVEENSRLKDKFLCKICMEERVRITFMPCGHLACCATCSMAVNICPICRTPIDGRLKTIF